MGIYNSMYPGTLVLPNGEKIMPKAEGVILTPDALENAGVQGWIASKWLEPAPAPAPETSSKTVPAKK